MVVGSAAFGLIIGAPTEHIVGKIADKNMQTDGSIDEFNLNKDKLKGYSKKK